MYACITRETFVFTIFRRVFHSILKLELCRHACRRRDQIIPTCRYGKNMPTTALVSTKGGNLLHQRVPQKTNKQNKKQNTHTHPNKNIFLQILTTLLSSTYKLTYLNSEQICKFTQITNSGYHFELSLFPLDNVHFQNSADLVRALVEEEIQHQVQVSSRLNIYTHLKNQSSVTCAY